jgi:phosphoribosyl-AMP cyclohydrolase
VQDAASKQVLLLAYTNEAAFQQTLQTKIATFWSTSRNQLWVKGKTSGDYLAVQQIKVNCEQNSLLYLVQPQGQGACHTKDPQGKPHATCYYRQVINSQQLKLDAL